MICVYSANCTDFSSNGLGIVAPQSCAVTEMLNGEYELTLVHPLDEQGKWILTKSISRFARNIMTMLSTVRELKSLGILIFFKEQNVDTLSEEVELMLTLYASVA